jgi:hypothetical protein
MLGLGLTTEQIIEILSAYSAAESTVPAVPASPGWRVVGAFPMPITASGIVLSAVGSVSDDSLTMRLRLFCITPGAVAEVAGSRVTITSTTDTQASSGTFALVGGRVYQFQAEVTGDTGSHFFGVVESAFISNA